MSASRGPSAKESERLERCEKLASRIALLPVTLWERRQVACALLPCRALWGDGLAGRWRSNKERGPYEGAFVRAVQGAWVRVSPVVSTPLCCVGHGPLG